MSTPILQVDSFARAPFTGNPAAVCPVSDEPDAGWMQAVATEMNLSETAFVWPLDARGAFGLRWFTPAAEVDLCGHATLAAAHALWTTDRLALDAPAVFRTLSGELVCRRLADGRIEMDFPVEPPAACEAPAGLAAAIPAPVAWVGKNRLDWLIELESEAAVRALSPDFSAVAKLGMRGTIVTARAEEGAAYDFVSRVFAPQLGIPEDPVTGSAHCALTPHWCVKLERAPLTGFQASARGGEVEVEPRGERVLLRGRAITTLEGTLLSDPPAKA